MGGEGRVGRSALLRTPLSPAVRPRLSLVAVAEASLNYCWAQSPFRRFIVGVAASPKHLCCLKADVRTVIFSGSWISEPSHVDVETQGASPWHRLQGGPDRARPGRRFDDRQPRSATEHCHA